MSMRKLGVFLIALLVGVSITAVSPGIISSGMSIIAEVEAAGSAGLPGAKGNEGSPSQNWVRSSPEGSVFVEVELLNPDSIAEDGEIKLRMYMTTHSGDLTTLDLGKLIEVSIDGTSLGMPSRWAWNQASSHHPVVDVSIKLPDGIKKVGQLALVLKDVGGVKVRRFTWDLNITVVARGGAASGRPDQTEPISASK